MPNFDDFVPNIGQALFLKVHSPNKLMKGAVRSGKSIAATVDDINDAELYPGIHILVTRTTQGPLYANHFNDYMNWCPQRLLGQAPRKTTTDITVYHRNGSQIIFKAFEEHDIEKVRSSEFGKIRIEEANLMTPYMHSLLQTRLSQSMGNAVDEQGRKYQSRIPDEAHVMVMVTNPGRDWIWRMYDRDNPDCYEFDLTDEGDVVPKNKKYFAVRLKTRDNLVNLPMDYMDRMSGLDKDFYRMMIEGEDVLLQGLIFPMFDRKVHVLDDERFIPPPHWPVYIGIDFGIKNNTHVSWITVTEEGHWIVFYEYFANGMSPRKHTSAVLEITADLIRRGMPIPKLAVIDPSTAQQKGEGETTVYQQFVDSGLSNLMPGKRESRDFQGVSFLRQLLELNPKVRHPLTGVTTERGWPNLYFTRNCKQIIQEFEEWKWKQHRDEKKDAPESPEEKNDHGIDSIKHVLLLGLKGAPSDPMAQEMFKNSFAYQQQKLITRDLKGKGRNGGFMGRLRASGVVS